MVDEQGTLGMRHLIERQILGKVNAADGDNVRSVVDNW
jgi:hypothetical protein